MDVTEKQTQKFYSISVLFFCRFYHSITSPLWKWSEKCSTCFFL